MLLYVQCAFIMGLALFPSLALIYYFWTHSEHLSGMVRILGMSWLLAIGYFLYAIVVIFVVAGVAFILRLKIKEGRHYVYSMEAIKWANYNSLILIVRYTCMNFLRVTPLLPLFYKMMGAKIGKNVQINTCVISDCSLLEIGDNAVIGGDVTLIAHAAERDQLIVKRVFIGTNVTLGLLSVIMPGVHIGDHAVIAAHSMVTKDTVVPAHATWGGVPAKPIQKSIS